MSDFDRYRTSVEDERDEREHERNERLRDVPPGKHPGYGYGHENTDRTYAEERGERPHHGR